jgi:drug/metabolite transporter (DMT)-like permease
MFQGNVAIPPVPAQVTVQHFTTGRLVAGIVMAVVGIPLIAVGSLYLADPASLPRSILPDTKDQADTIGGVMAGVGGALTLAGVITMATTKTNHADVRALAPVGPRMAGRLQLIGVGISPTADRSGAVAGLAARF